MNRMGWFASAALLCMLGSSGAWAQDKTETTDAKPAVARVRFFGQAAIGIKFFKNQSCIGGDGIQASKKNFGGMFAKNVSIGMPITPTVENMKSRDGILFAASYHEFAVRANEPLAISVDYSETTGVRSYRCDQIGGVFKPEAGQDYDITVDLVNGTCAVNVQKIEVRDSAMQLLPVPLDGTRKCTADDVLPINVCKATFEECKTNVIEKFKETDPEGKPGKAAFAECTARYKSCVADTR
jgi:hypothetical protein